MDLQVDPNLVNSAYKQMLAQANDQVALLQAAATHQQNRITQLEKENEQLQAANQQLLSESGRQDGMPQWETAAAG